MASKTDWKPLIQIGPFKGLDSSGAGDYVAPGDGVAISNVDTNRLAGAMTNFRGRVTAPGTAVINTDTGIAGTYSALYDVSSTSHYIVTSLTGSAFARELAAFDPYTGTSILHYYAVQPGGFGHLAFNQAVQFNGKMWLNSGFQLSIPSGNSASECQQWQYPPPGLGIFGYTSIASGNIYYPITASTSTGATVSALGAGTYYYAFTYVVTLPDGTVQETSPTGAYSIPSGNATNKVSQPYPFQATVTGNNSGAGSYNSISITPYLSSPALSSSTPVTSNNWGGTFPDGSTYSTNVYRQSSNVPVWYLLVNKTDANQTAYVDLVADATIQSNQQIVLAQDPPPLNVIQNVPAGPPGAPGYNTAPNLAPIFVHQERIWVFANVQAQNVGPTGLPNQGQLTNAPNLVWQSQLWYSALGTPYQYDQVNQVLLVGNSSTPVSPAYTGYGDDPVAGISMGSIGVLFKSRSTWGVFGNDPSTYVVTKLFDIGCIARLSVISALGTVYWLSEEGVYSFNGNAPVYISQKIRNTLKGLPFNVLQTAVSFFNDLSLYIMFPGYGTFQYYTVDGTWSELLINETQIVSQPANPNIAAASFGAATSYPGEVLSLTQTTAGAITTFGAHQWFASEQDLGNNISFSWQSPLTASGNPAAEKVYEYIVFMIPYQTQSGATQAGTVTGTLTIDPGSSPAKVFDFSFTIGPTPGPTNLYPYQPQSRYILRIPPEFRGFQAQLTFTATNTNTTQPLSIWSAQVWGREDRMLVLPSGSGN